LSASILGGAERSARKIEAAPMDGPWCQEMPLVAPRYQNTAFYTMKCKRTGEKTAPWRGYFYRWVLCGADSTAAVVAAAE
jgi:hypothetical protein